MFSHSYEYSPLFLRLAARLSFIPYEGWHEKSCTTLLTAPSLKEVRELLRTAQIQANATGIANFAVA